MNTEATPRTISARTGSRGPGADPAALRGEESTIPRRTGRLRDSVGLALAGLVLVAVTGCTPDTPSAGASPTTSGRASASPSEPQASPDPSEPASSTSPSAAPTASPTPTPSASGGSPTPTPPAPTATPSAPVDDSAVPIGAGCLDLVSLETMYAYNPNVGADGAYQPGSATNAATAVANGGVACGWIQQSSGELIEIAAAHPGDATLARLRGTASNGTPSVSTSGVEQFFSSSGSSGTLQAFDADGDWVVVTGPGFIEAADAQPLLDSALAAVS